MGCVYSLPEDGRPIGEIVANYKTVKQKRLNPPLFVKKAAPQIRTVKIPDRSVGAAPVMPVMMVSYRKIEILKERAFMKEAHALLANGASDLRSLSEIFEAVHKAADIRRNELLSNTRVRKVCRARQIYMYLARKMTVKSSPQIGEYLGGKDHSTVLHGIKTINTYLDEGDAWVTMVVAQATKILEEAGK